MIIKYIKDKQDRVNDINNPQLANEEILAQGSDILSCFKKGIIKHIH